MSNNSHIVLENLEIYKFILKIFYYIYIFPVANNLFVDLFLKLLYPLCQYIDQEKISVYTLAINTTFNLNTKLGSAKN